MNTEDLARRIEETPAGPFAILLGLTEDHFSDIVASRNKIVAALRSVDNLTRLQAHPSERYWEARWRDEKADNTHLRMALEVVDDWHEAGENPIELIQVMTIVQWALLGGADDAVNASEDFAITGST